MSPVPDPQAPEAVADPLLAPLDLPRFEWRPLQTVVPTYSLTVADADLEALYENVWADDFTVPAQFGFEGRTWKVKLRFRGHSSRQFPKKSFQVKFPKDDPFFGRKRLELNAQYKDGGLLTEKLWYDLAAANGLRVPQTQFVNLDINGERHGLMLELERIDTVFVRVHGLPDGAPIYRAGMFDGELRDRPGHEYQEPWEKRTREDEPDDELWAFLNAVNRTPAHQLADTLRAQLDLDAYLRWLAVDAVSANDLWMDARSFLIREPGGRWHFVPWDLNNATSVLSRLEPLQDQWNGWSRPLLDYTAWDPRAYQIAREREEAGLFPRVAPAWSVLNTRIVADPALRRRYVEEIEKLLQSSFREEVLHPRIDAMAALIAPHVAADRYLDQPYVQAGPAFLKKFVTDRRGYLRYALDSVGKPPQPGWTIHRVGLDAGGQFFVTLHNGSARAASLGGLRLSGDPRNPEQQVLAQISVEAGATVTLSASASDPSLRLRAAIDPDLPELALVAADGTEVLDVWFLPALKAGEVYGRIQPGGAEFGWIR